MNKKIWVVLLELVLLCKTEIISCFEMDEFDFPYANYSEVDGVI